MDANLVQRLDGRPSLAMDVLIERHADRVRNYLAFLVRHPDDADDLTQEVFLRVVRAADSYDPSRPFDAWLFRIARHAAIDFRRREHRRPRGDGFPSEAEFPHPGPGPSHALENGELAGELARAIQDLPEPYRSAFLLREMEGLSYEVIGEVLGIGGKTVSSRLNRARARLRERLSEWLPEGSRSEHTP